MSSSKLTSHLRSVSSNANNPLLPLAGRVLLGAVFLWSGWLNLTNPTGTIGYIAAVGLPLPEAAYAASLVVEIGGALLLVSGYCTRLAASALVLFALMTAFFFHFQPSNPEELMHFFKNLAMTGGLLQVVAFGAGAYSLDRWRQLARARAAA